MSTHKNDSVEGISEVVKAVSTIVTEMAGIQLGPKQYSMVENRLKTRMLRLDLKSFESYLSYLKQNRESESQALLSLMTTHHTYFFREFSHFEFLLNRGLPRLVQMARDREDKTIRVFSAACSKGQEVYSLAMFFEFHLKTVAPDLKYEIWGADIDPESVKHAKNGVYRADELKQSPAMYIDGQWIRGTGNVREFSKVRDHLKARCHFSTFNALSNDPLPSGKSFDVIFCRNIFIYFNQDQIKQASQRLLGSLQQEGFLFLGVSESLSGMSLKIDTVGPSVYQHKQLAKAPGVAPSKSLPPAPVAKTYQVLCVDDSPTVHALLGKILVKDQGFQIAAKAKNGREALDILKTQKFDVITLDLHMPELDGVGFLKEFQGNKTPVIVVSSINRDDTSIAQEAMSLGAADYVEKPSLENLAQAANEIRSKLKMVISRSPGAAAAGVPVNSVPATSASSSKPAPANSKLNSKIKVMIVDDSATIRNILSAVLKKDPRFQVVAEAEKPSQVEALIEKHHPDVITLDIHMPEMDGVTLLKKIQPKYKIPAVMISSISREEGNYVLDALASGAIDYIQKPQASDLSEVATQICERLATAAQAKVAASPIRVKKSHAVTGPINMESLIVLGASTGGTEALRVVLEGLPSQIPPILIVQHIPPVFSAAFASRLNNLVQFEVKEAQDGDEVRKNRVLVAPGGTQLGVKWNKDKLVVTVTDEAPVNRHKPSVDYLFHSVQKLKLRNVTAAILTGMGADGARGMKALRDSGARTIAQDQDTCVVYGMPKEAVKMGGAEFVMPLQEISGQILSLSELKKTPTKKIA